MTASGRWIEERSTRRHSSVGMFTQVRSAERPRSDGTRRLIAWTPFGVNLIDLLGVRVPGVDLGGPGGGGPILVDIALPRRTLACQRVRSPRPGATTQPQVPWTFGERHDNGGPTSCRLLGPVRPVLAVLAL
jgi:hypothetical protein